MGPESGSRGSRRCCCAPRKQCCCEIEIKNRTQLVHTSLPGCETIEIRAPIVVRLLIFSPKARGYAYKTGHGDHARGVAALSSFPVPEIVRKNREFARIAHKRPSGHPANRSTARWVSLGLRSVWTEDAYPNDKSAVFVASSGQISLAAAAPRMSHAVHGEGERRDGLPRELPCAGC